MSDDNTVYLITGGNRGIGKSIALLLGQRPHTTIITTARKDSNQGIAVVPSSRHIEILLDEDNPDISSETLESGLSDFGIFRLDVVVANAGSSTQFTPLLTTPPKAYLADFTTNTLGPIKLFQAIWPMMTESKVRKFVLITSTVGSIGCLAEESFPSGGYGVSKVAANWWARKLSLELEGEGLKVGIVHPGWVKTPMGQALADAVDFPEPPMDAYDSARAVLERIDELDTETSGKFLNYNGKEIPW